MIVVQLCILCSGHEFTPLINLLLFFPFLFGIGFNAYSYANANNNYVTLNSLFGSCFKAVIIILAVRMVWLPVADLLFPQIIEGALWQMHDQIYYSPKFSSRQMETAYTTAERFWYVSRFTGLIFSTMLFGVIFSLIGCGLIEKKGLRPLETDSF